MARYRSEPLGAGIEQYRAQGFLLPGKVLVHDVGGPGPDGRPLAQGHVLVRP
jgi:hypothetical protein